MLSAMDGNLTALERAFELAKSGDCASVADLRKRLKGEGYSLQKIVGRSLSRQLEMLIKASATENRASGSNAPRCGCPALK
jgi:hypothetical protein